MSIGTQIDRYLARLIFVPLVGTLCLAAMLLLMDRMLKLFDFVVSEGGPVSIVFRMLANLIPEYMGLAIPVGLTLGVLLAFRKLALSSELDSLRAVGLSYGRLLRVPFIYAVALLGLNFFIVGYVQPQAQYEYQSLRHELRSGALGASIKVGEFTDLGRRMTLRVERSENRGTDLHGVFLHLQQSRGRTVTASAARGTFLATDDPDTILLRLTNGRLVHNAPGYRVPRVLSFVQHDLPIDLPTIEAFRGRGDGTKEMTVAELLRTGQDARTPVNRRNAALANFYFRMVEVLMMLLVPLLAVALAVPPKRSTSGLGHLPRDRLRRHLSQGQPICRADGGAGQDRSADRGRHAVPDLLGPDDLDVLDPRPQARRPADRRPRAAVRAHLQAHSPPVPPPRVRRSGGSGRGRRRRMINLQFFPSKRLAFYMARLFLTRSAAVLVALVAILMMLDLLGNSGKILAHPGQWRRRIVALCRPARAPAHRPLPALLGPARRADHVGRRSTRIARSSR